MSRVAAVGIVFALCLSGATRAVASEAGVDAATGDVVVRARPGEGNYFTLRVPADSRRLVRVRDGGAPLRAAAGCVAVDDHTAECGRLVGVPLPQIPLQPNVRVEGGDGADTVVSSLPGYGDYGGQVRMEGGSGNDVLVGSMLLGADGGPGDDVIASADGELGGFGSVLRGGPGRDYVHGEGLDQINEGDDDSSPDHLAGSTVSYLGRASGVRIDLRGSASSAANAEGDLLVGTRAVIGTDHDDVLIATRDTDARGTELFGMGGEDLLHGSDQHDYLNGGAGVDRLIGGRGDDKLVEQTGTVSCGPGHDVIQLLVHTPGADCEENEIDPPTLRLAASLRGRTLLVRVRVPTIGDASLPGDRVRVSVPLGRASVTYPPVSLRDLPLTLRIPLGPRALEAVRRRHSVAVRYRAAGKVWRAAPTAHLRVRIRHTPSRSSR